MRSWCRRGGVVDVRRRGTVIGLGFSSAVEEVKRDCTVTDLSGGLEVYRAVVYVRCERHRGMSFPV